MFRQMDLLFIKLRLPVTTISSSVFRTFRINSIPIPLGPEHKDRTLIEFDRTYLAIIYDNVFFLLLCQKMNLSLVR